MTVKWLLVGSTGAEPLEWELEEGRHRLGRASHNDVVLSDPSISKTHAEIEIRDEGAVIRDLESRNGTWVNNRRIVEETPLAHGDRIRVGGLDLEIFSGQLPRPLRFESASFSEPGQIHTTRSVGRQAILDELGLITRPDGRLLRAVTEAGKLLASHQPIEEVFESVLDLAADVIPARRILLLLSEKTDDPPVVRAARPKGSAGERILLSRTLLDAVILGGKSLLVGDTLTDPRFQAQESIVIQDIRSALAAPLFDNERNLGLIYADTNDPRVRYDDDQLRVFTLLANLIAIKITNTRLMVAQLAKERMEQEMATAAMIQKRLLPAELPPVEGYEMAARLNSCIEVGGDLYDACVLSDGATGIAVGDVAGHGLGAALLMSHVMAALRILSEERLPLENLAERIHREVLRVSSPRDFVTLFIGRLDAKKHRLDYVNAGHNPPFLLLKEGDVRTLDSTGMPIGMMEGFPFDAASCDFPPGALLAIFSDGITEAASAEDLFGEERLIDALRRHSDLPIQAIAEGVLEEVRSFVGHEPASDDITLFLLRRTG
jgi:serine phosphatase RsbU (regulator of sigma subunit)